MKITKIVLSYSVLNEYRTCATKFKYHYLEALVKPFLPSIERGSPLEFGRLVHTFLELYHGGVPADDALTAVLKEASGSSLADVEANKLRSLLHLELLLRGYVANYPDPNGEFHPIRIAGKAALETEVDTLLSVNPTVIWRQHYDGVVEDASGNVSILEHKTASGNLHEDLVERMMPNDQAVGYVYGARKSLGLDVKGVLFNGLCTYRPLVNPGYKPKSGVSLPLFYRRFVPVESWQMEEWETETLRTIKRLIEDIEEGAFAKNAPDACTVFNSRCPYADLCKTAPLGRDNLIDLCYNKETWKGFEIAYE